LVLEIDRQEVRRQRSERSGPACDSTHDLPPRSPNLNAYAERFVRSIKEECLSRVVVLGESQLRFILQQYIEHYHGERNHQGLDNRLVEPAPAPVNPGTEVNRRERIGGLLDYYYRAAA
jgi:putative transposase